MRRLTPSFRGKIWGSSHLEPWYRDRGAKIGEVWFEDTQPLPLLVKFIFTTDKLSVQVHPGDEYAARFHGSRGKTEMWHILAAEPGARIAAGFREPVSAARLREAAVSGEIEELLDWHPATPGDTFFIPAGTVHAIGAGLVLCEIQQHSDVTYRLYDYGRLENGKPRELHLDHAAAVSHREQYQPRPQTGNALVSCDYFTVSRRHVTGSVKIAEAPPRFLIAIEGQGTIGGEPARAGEAWFTEDAAGDVEIAGDLTLLEARAA